MSDQWQADFFEKSAVFDDIAGLLQKQRWSDWPSCEALMRLMDDPICNIQNIPIQFHRQDHTLPNPEFYYEARIFQTGVISTRSANWHDFFNALIWLGYPTIKALLNAQHVTELRHQPSKKRTTKRDALTLFDECGVIFAYCDEGRQKALEAHEWKGLFWRNRSDWGRVCGAYVFGHALYEKALNPYLGLTGKALSIQVNEAFFHKPIKQQWFILDQLVCQHILQNDGLSSPADLAAFPLLGVPGWYAENISEVFYENSQYFRPKV